MAGRSVRIFMADGSVFGIRQCEISNRTIQGLAVSRGRFSELKSWEESERAGVYFLFGKNEKGDPMAYVGEAQRVGDRLSAHVREKEFWNEAVIFVNKDANMHPKYLEARLIAMAGSAGRYKLENGKGHDNPVLSRADKDAMEETLSDIRLILGVLGHPILEPVDVPVMPPQTSEAIGAVHPLLGREFAFDGPKFSAKGRVTDEGFLILRGSSAAPEFTAGAPGYLRMREKLIEDGALVLESDRYVFTRDISANSSSQAAAIVAGGNRSGRVSWKSDGKTLANLEEEAVEPEAKESESRG